MADVKIVVEEKLGGQVSFGGKEIRVLKATYDAIPEDKRSEFDGLLVRAQEVYQEKVAAVKAAGQRPQASKLKSEAIAEVITPFMEANSVAKGSAKRGESRVVKPTVKKEGQRAKEPKAPMDSDSIKKECDNFPAELLEDSSSAPAGGEKPKGDFDDLDDELGIDDVLDKGEEVAEGGSGGGEDPFAGEDDPFAVKEGEDPFDIDMDI